MRKYFMHYRPADAAEDVRAVVEAPSYRAALAQVRRACRGVTVYSAKEARPADVEAAAKGVSRGRLDAS
ncbi:MAG: hypothetical protein LBU23_07390 [Planctomycetota bacterium]|nr:hypothetical protein [Planctomycetota bacterium]